MRLQAFAIAGALMLTAGVAIAQDSGTACFVAAGVDRAAILDAIRAPVSRDLRTVVEFVVERARVCGGWVFVIATPQRRDKGAMRWSGTPCGGDTSHLVGGLVRRTAAGWELVDYALCPSDVAWDDWPRKYKAPRELFDE